MNLLEFGYIAFLLSKEYNCEKDNKDCLGEFLYDCACMVDWNPQETDFEGRAEFFTKFESWLTIGDKS